MDRNIYCLFVEHDADNGEIALTQIYIEASFS